MATYLPGTLPDPNKQIEILPAAIQQICEYPLASVRKDFTPLEWTTYKNDWKVFDTIWSYNYSVSTVNGQEGYKKYSPYQFLNFNQRNSYLKGQFAHIDYYTEAAAQNLFANIIF